MRTFAQPRLPLAWLIIWFGAALLVSQTQLASPDPMTLSRALHLPGIPHLFGFDSFGRDLLILTLKSSLISALFAASAVGVATLFGILAGTTLALSPPRLLGVLLSLLDLFLAFPSLLLALALAAVLGPGWITLVTALLIGIIPSYSRLVYVRARELLTEDYVLAAQSFGATRAHIAIKHLTPAVLSLCRVKAPNLFAHALMAEATLSFLGVGAPAGRDTWGSLLLQGQAYLIEAPHIALGVGLPLVVTVLALQALTSPDFASRESLPKNS